MFTVVLSPPGSGADPDMISTLIVEDDFHVATIHAAYIRRVRGFDVCGHAATLATARAEPPAWPHANPPRAGHRPLLGQARFAQLEERLMTYPASTPAWTGWWRRSSTRSTPVRAAARGGTPAQGPVRPTMARIRERPRWAAEDLSAGEVAASIGVSRSTAQRYLSELAR